MRSFLNGLCKKRVLSKNRRLQRNESWDIIDTNTYSLTLLHYWAKRKKKLSHALIECKTPRLFLSEHYLWMKCLPKNSIKKVAVILAKLQITALKSCYFASITHVSQVIYSIIPAACTFFCGCRDNSFLPNSRLSSCPD